jgi:C-terminal processing protease CtpA/Prc
MDATATLRACLAQQRGWLLAQLIDVSAAVHDLSSPAAGCGLAPGDVLTHVDGAALAGASFDDAAAAVAAAPRTAHVRALRVQLVPVLDALGALLLQTE